MTPPHHHQLMTWFITSSSPWPSKKVLLSRARVISATKDATERELFYQEIVAQSIWIGGLFLMNMHTNVLAYKG